MINSRTQCDESKNDIGKNIQQKCMSHEMYVEKICSL